MFKLNIPDFVNPQLQASKHFWTLLFVNLQIKPQHISHYYCTKLKH